MKTRLLHFALLTLVLAAASHSYAQRRPSALAAVPVPGQPVTPTPTPTPVPTTPQAPGITRPPTAATPAAPGAKPEEQLRIVADPATNSLIIYGTVQEFQNIRTILKDLDAVPRQVLLDVLIAEVTLNNDDSFGVDYQILQRNPASIFGRGFGSAGALRTLSADAFNGAFGTGSGFSGVFGGRDIKALVTALESDSRARILSSPSILASDNRPARIQVGSEEPVATGTITGAVGTVASSTTIQYRNTGRIVTIIPQVNSLGLVNLQILAEVSQRGVAVPVGPDSFPSFDTRQAETSAVVQDGDTLAIGGIIAENKTRDRTGLPYLMNLPIVGRFFGSTTDSVRRTELLMLITPHVIRNRDEARDVTEDFKSRVSTIKTEIERYERDNAVMRARQLSRPQPDIDIRPSVPVFPSPVPPQTPAPAAKPTDSSLSQPPQVVPGALPSAPVPPVTYPTPAVPLSPPVQNRPQGAQSDLNRHIAVRPEDLEAVPSQPDTMTALLTAIETHEARSSAPASAPAAAPALPRRVPVSQPPQAPVWYVQVVSYGRQRDADVMVNRLKAHGYDAVVSSAEVRGQIYYRVEVGHLPNRSAALELQKNLKIMEKFDETLIATR
ncbi:MAG TPA: SPOR domain-containing protein [Candidatus Binatia bacterium]